ncbi:MAG: OmpA family protein [Rhizobiales bacterium]|nr:OmpA family protein [Hyphomicrobiales bacterium]MBO6699919.1 OmpA family protein [Hyphomicrobiales bacterium]MBO6737457.1 OmpA family protein [Hyphomicrobiales bacterium]MBO6911469.1 OmpA family protein [Hyphomicrobiales bacterium]MBO6955231.1 OmpA family protein [Hyphomicrobiales bacterium]
MMILSLTSKAFRGSTAIVLALAMASPITGPSSLAIAQTVDIDPGTLAIDCAVNPTDPACDVDSPVELEALPETPVEESVIDEPIVDETAVEETVVEELPLEMPAAEATTEPVDAPEELVSQEPVSEDVIVDEPVAEAAPEDEEAPQELVTEELVVEEPLAETPLEGEQAVEATVEEAVTEAPADSDVAPAAETTTASDEQPTEAPAPEGNLAETPPTPEPAPSEAASGEPAPETPSEPTTVADESPASVIPDDATEEQAATIQAQEAQRREDARDRRAELLGAAAVGAVVGALIPALGGRVVEDQGDRLIVERDGEFFVRGDESSLLRNGDAEVRFERLRGGLTQETITRRNGAQIITIRDEGGYILYRSRIRPNGREIVLIDNRNIDDRAFVDVRDLPPLQLTIPRDRYVVPAQRADFDVFFETFAAPTVVELDEAFTLRQVRENVAVRDLVRRVDLDSITFETGQATVRRSQVPLLEGIALATLALIDRDPSTLLLVEGHTDAIGSDIANLALSDRRAETVARILVNFYDVPPENLVIQGYGERFLKIETQAAEEQNRRVTIRNITPLIGSAN